MIGVCWRLVIIYEQTLVGIKPTNSPWSVCHSASTMVSCTSSTTADQRCIMSPASESQIGGFWLESNCMPRGKRFTGVWRYQPSLLAEPNIRSWFKGMTKISCTFPTLKRMTHLAARFDDIRRSSDFNSTSGWLFQFKNKVRKHGHNQLTHYSFVDCSSSNSSYVSPTPFLTLTVLRGYNWTKSLHTVSNVDNKTLYMSFDPYVSVHNSGNCREFYYQPNLSDLVRSSTPRCHRLDLFYLVSSLCRIPKAHCGW
jgi:hypothetical protein